LSVLLIPADACREVGDSVFQQNRISFVEPTLYAGLSNLDEIPLLRNHHVIRRF
jgi:hypothetical protein